MFMRALIILLFLVVAYLIMWPSPINPVAWQAPPDKGFVGVFETNDALSVFDAFELVGHGPEDIVFSGDGQGYTGLENGWIVKFDPKSGSQENWFNTGGRPLGLEFGPGGALYVADSVKGLLRIYPDRSMDVLATEFEGITMGFVDDLDVTRSGDVYFSDASTKFSAIELGEAEASFYDVVEHSASGRILKYDASSGELSLVFEGLSFANGVALDPEDQFLLVTETGGYRVHKYWLHGERAGQSEVILENLPGMPDNINADSQGRFWLALFSPRNALLDMFADSPGVRSIMAKLPTFVRPKPEKYAHIVEINGVGDVIASYQDPNQTFMASTGAVAFGGELWVGSLHEGKMLRGSLRP